MALTQYIGALFYFINKDFFYAWMAFIKSGISIMLVTITQLWAPTIVTVSGDRSVSEQIHQLPDGTIQLDFSDRMVLLSNHQVSCTVSCRC
jgi:lysocardiolipin and lysophospholipid acyltransferase